MDQNVPNPSRLRLTDALNVIALLTAIICIGSAFLVTNTTVQSVLISLGASLLVVPALYFLTRYFLVSSNAPRIETFFGSSDRIFELAQYRLQRLLKPGRRVTVRIYAPVGIWYESEEKRRWLEMLAQLASERRIYLEAVYGLPPATQQDLSDENSCARVRLRLFRNKPSVHIRYIPPPREQGGCSMPAAPGLGIVTFDEELALIAFAPEEAETPVTRGLMIRGTKAVGPIVRWFDEQFFKSPGSKLLVQNSDQNIHPQQFDAAFAELLGQYYMLQAVQPVIA